MLVSACVAAAMAIAIPAPAVAAPLATVFAAAPKVTPEQAAAARKATQERARVLIQSGDARTAGVELDAKAAELADPLLFLDAADAYYQAGEADAHIPTVEAGIERARIALDILHFLQDPAADKSFKQVPDWQVGSLIERANEHLRRSNELIASIEAAESAPPEAPADEGKKRRKGSGKGMVIGGVIMGTVGVGGIGLGVAGLAIGKVNQNAVEDPTVYGDEYDDFEAKGKTGNMLAIVGLAAGGALLAGGVVLLAIGLKRRGKSTQESARLRVSPAPNGMVLHGRF